MPCLDSLALTRKESGSYLAKILLTLALWDPEGSG